EDEIEVLRVELVDRLDAGAGLLDGVTCARQIGSRHQLVGEVVLDQEDSETLPATHHAIPICPSPFARRGSAPASSAIGKLIKNEQVVPAPISLMILISPP